MQLAEIGLNILSEGMGALTNVGRCIDWAIDSELCPHIFGGKSHIGLEKFESTSFASRFHLYGYYLPNIG